MAAPAGGNTMTGGSGDDIFFAKNSAADHHHRACPATRPYIDPQDIVTRHSGVTEINPP